VNSGAIRQILLIALFLFSACHRAKTPPPSPAPHFQTDYLELDLPDASWSCAEVPGDCPVWECRSRGGPGLLRFARRHATDSESTMDGNWVELDKPGPCDPAGMAGKPVDGVEIGGTDWKKVESGGTRYYFKRAGAWVLRAEAVAPASVATMHLR